MQAVSYVIGKPIFKDLDGFHISSILDEDTVRSALSYKPRPDDIFIVTYPRSGSTWTRYIVYSILNDGADPKDLADMALMSPWLEFLGAESAEKMVRPGAIKCHLPFYKQPYSERAKYICVVRNPYDCCVSYFHHVRSFPHFGVEDVPFDQFLGLFLRGEVGGGDYFDHLLSWYEHRDDSNVLFLRYEDLKKDAKTSVLNIADFLGEEHGRKLRQGELLDKVVNDTSFKNLESLVNDCLKCFVSDLVSLPPEKQLKALEVFGQAFSDQRQLEPKGKFLRKGIVGDYKEHFSAEQIERMKERIAFKTEGSHVMNLWADMELP